eukprot:3283815-Amphidinium_carterae.3
MPQTKIETWAWSYTSDVSKTMPRQPMLQPQFALTLLQAWQAQPRHDGIVVCGLPIWTDAIDPSVSAIPCGSPGFIQQFLAKQHTSAGRRLEACVALAETFGTDHSGEHLSLHSSRLSISAMHIHLLHAIHPSVMEP